MLRNIVKNPTTGGECFESKDLHAENIAWAQITRGRNCFPYAEDFGTPIARASFCASQLANR